MVSAISAVGNSILYLKLPSALGIEIVPLAGAPLTSITEEGTCVAVSEPFLIQYVKKNLSE
jgi:hypothetical protein